MLKLLDTNRQDEINFQLRSARYSILVQKYGADVAADDERMRAIKKYLRPRKEEKYKVREDRKADIVETLILALNAGVQFTATTPIVLNLDGNEPKVDIPNMETLVTI